MQSPEARQYDEVQTPDSGGKSKRNFGVRRRKYGGASDRIVENAHDGRSARAGETAAFERVRRQSAMGRQIENFNFADDADSHAFGRNAHHQADGSVGTGKYAQPARSSIRPGASIMGSESRLSHPVANEEEQRLRQLGPPRREMSDFEKIILSKRKPAVSSVAAGAGASRVQPPRITNGKRLVGSLECASAPTSAYTLKKPLSVIPSRSEWQAPTRLERTSAPPQGAKRARVELTPARLAGRVAVGTKDAAPTSGGATRVSARIQSRPTRDTFGMYDDDDIATAPVSASVASRFITKHSTGSMLSRTSIGGVTTPLLRRSTRSTPNPKDGTEDMPINLSDSDEEDDNDPPSVRDQQVSNTDSHSEAVDDKNFDMNAVRKESVIEYQATRAWFGERACHVDVYIGQEVVWLCSVRGVEEKWPLESNFRISLKRMKRILAYQWTPDQVGTVDTSDPAGKVMSSISFIAFQFPIPNVLRKAEWREFYDPDADESSSKRYLIMLAKDDDRDGTILSTMGDMLQRHLDVESLNTLDDVRPLAKQMIEHDDHYVFRDRPRTDETRRSRRRREAEDAGMDATQLTYPLPPCTVDVVTITRQDIARLQPAEYLNDNIIDYYLKRLLIEDYASNELVKQNVLFLSSHFYSRLRAGKGATMRERLAAGYKNVSTWLTRSDLFSRTLVFVPINKDLHWSLAVIVNPKCAGTKKESDGENSPQTCIALLDPLGGYHSIIPILRNLKSFLEFEWERAFGVNTYEPTHVAKIKVIAPTQKNSYDCGVFVLKYAQEMLTNFAKILVDLAPDKESPRDGVLLPREITDDGLADLIPYDAFTPSDVTNKRTELQALLADDTKAYEAIVDAKTEAKQAKAEV